MEFSFQNYSIESGIHCQVEILLRTKVFLVSQGSENILQSSFVLEIEIYICVVFVI